MKNWVKGTNANKATVFMSSYQSQKQMCDIRRWRYYDSESKGGLKASLNKRALLIVEPGHRFILSLNNIPFLTVAGLRNWKHSFLKHKEVRLFNVNMTAGL